MYSEVFDSTDEMDKEINISATILSNSNPEPMNGLKKVMWEGTEHWDQLLKEEADAVGP